MTDFQIETVQLDLPAVSGAFGRRLHDAGIPVTAERSARFARALRLVDPRLRRRLYRTARAVFVSDPSQVTAFNAVFADVFGAPESEHAQPVPDAETVGSPPAIVNAVVDALALDGVRHVDMPCTPSRVWEAMHAARR